MLKISTLVFVFACLRATSAVSVWGQCGGIGYTGSTVCDAGSVCTVQNAYYSQCLPGTATVTTTSVSTTSSATSTTSSSGSTTTAVPPTVTGFVKTSGQKFTLNGAGFVPVGTNAYWLAQVANANIDKAFADIAAAGFTTVRTWGFNEVTSPSGTYYQSWSNGVPTLNTGSTGLAKFDYVVSSAKAHGIRLIVALTNNWSDYGGMDVYVSQLNNGGTHDTFYTNAKIQTAFQNYIKGFVGRYVSEPGIMAWELANEPRCGGSSGSPSASCNSTTLFNWAKTTSAFIKSIDSNHLVAIGDEGWINSANPPSYPYQGNSIGIDFQANLAITTLDFGTFHLYPESWGQSANITGFGTQWITDHAAMQKSANKPVIIEEFGVTSNQPTVYQSWLSTVSTSGLTGELIWQAGSHFPDGTNSWDDGYAIFPDSAAYPTVTAAAKALKTRG
ncbi:CEL4a mannanase [Exidia glandulosa HHB12029]|uniref:mannan endo-1,4-beta-mannosidase n=1 Tax=Exidia glandulosa HHB12029 TaxID=1314781 RepID=A0A165NU22_EXIGL|nr:CEL4a mannanase [Exidia glandulosa HHB12029]